MQESDYGSDYERT